MNRVCAIVAKWTVGERLDQRERAGMSARRVVQMKWGPGVRRLSQQVSFLIV